MKRPIIGFQLTSFAGHYQGRLRPGLEDVAVENDVHLILFSGSPIRTPVNFNYQYGVVYDLINPYIVDALILSSGTLSCF
jgi:hypothetical protein